MLQSFILFIGKQSSEILEMPGCITLYTDCSGIFEVKGERVWRSIGQRRSQTMETRCSLIFDFSINRSALDHPRNRGKRHALKPRFHDRFISSGETNVGNANSLLGKRVTARATRACIV